MGLFLGCFVRHLLKIAKADWTELGVLLLLLFWKFCGWFLRLLKFVDNEMLDLLHKEAELDLELLDLLAINSGVSIGEAFRGIKVIRYEK